MAADSTFAKLLLRGLSGGADFFHEGIISADELGIYLSREVPRYSQRSQTPQFNSLYQPPENLTPGGFPNGRKRDSMQHVVDSRSGQHAGNRDYTPGSEYFTVAGGGGAHG